jgi:predicted CoA-binding protein
MTLPPSVAAFLQGKTFAVAGVSRDAKRHVGNAIFNKLRDSGREVFAVNPNASEVEGVPSYPEIGAIPCKVDSVVIATPAAAALSLVRQCIDKGVKHIWFHAALGPKSGTTEAITEARARGISVVENGCPMMYVEPVDGGHKFICWCLRLFGKTPQ